MNGKRGSAGKANSGFPDSFQQFIVCMHAEELLTIIDDDLPEDLRARLIAMVDEPCRSRPEIFETEGLLLGCSLVFRKKITTKQLAKL